MWIFSLNASKLILYLLGCVAISSFTLGSFAKIVQASLAIRYDYKVEMLMVVGQIGFQWLFMLSATWKERKNYMTLALTVSMMGSVLLLPLIFCDYFFGVSDLTAIIYFFLVVAIIFLIHCKSVKWLLLPDILKFTWFLYRALLLFFVLVPRRHG